MCDPLDEDNKGKYDPWWFTVNISQYIIIFFYENDTNEVKGSYHDDCLEKKNPTYFAYWTWAWRLATPEIWILYKTELAKRARKIFSMFDIFLRIYALGPFLLIRLSWQTHPPYILIFHVVSPPYTAIFFLDPPPHTHLLINDWSHRLCCFLNILLFKILPQSC